MEILITPPTLELNNHTMNPPRNEVCLRIYI